MINGVVSQTALKVATMMLSLNVDRIWRERLPVGLADLTRELLLAARVPGYTPLIISLNERRTTYLASKAFERVMPGVFTGIGERKIFVDREARLAMEGGAQQVLVIGAGFDTLCLRLAPEFPAVTFVEIDHPATSNAKARGLSAVGQPDNLRQIAVDLGEQSLVDVLTGDSDWDLSKPSFVVAEGLLMYLTAEDVLALFGYVSHVTGPGSRIAFSYPLAVRRYAFSNALLRMIGEPWLSSTSKDTLADYIGDAWSVAKVEEPLGEKAIEGFAMAVRSGPASGDQC